VTNAVSFRRLFSRMRAVLAAALLLPGVPAFAVPITGGSTSVLLSAASALDSLGISVAPLGSASVSLSPDNTPIATFPITGGEIEAGDALIEHEGSGLSLSNSTSIVELEDFLIDTANALLSGVVTADGTQIGVVPLFSIGAGLSLSLTSEAGAALASVFGIPDLTGTVIGTATTNPVTGAVPEPGTLTLLLGAALALAYLRRARQPRARNRSGAYA
jgi:hypothetical protein